MIHREELQSMQVLDAGDIVECIKDCVIGIHDATETIAVKGQYPIVIDEVSDEIFHVRILGRKCWVVWENFRLRERKNPISDEEMLRRQSALCDAIVAKKESWSADCKKGFDRFQRNYRLGTKYQIQDGEKPWDGFAVILKSVAMQGATFVLQDYTERYVWNSELLKYPPRELSRSPSQNRRSGESRVSGQRISGTYSYWGDEEPECDKWEEKTIGGYTIADVQQHGDGLRGVVVHNGVVTVESWSIDGKHIEHAEMNLTRKIVA